MRISQAKLDYFFSTMNLSPKTQDWYQQKLEVFADWCTKKGISDLEDITRGTVARFLEDLRAGKKEVTLKGYAQVVRRFLNYCAEEGWMSKRKVDMPKPDDKIIDTFTSAQIRAMLAASTSHRDRAIVSLLCDTGIRASELCTLLTEDVVLSKEAGYIQVHGKGRKERQIPFGEQTRLVLWRYLRVRPSKPRTFFVSHRNAPLTVSGLDQIIYRLKRAVGPHRFPGVRVSAHTFRHTFAVNFLLAGGDLYVLSRLMGHTDIKTTQVYLKAMSQEQAKARYISPLNRLMEGA